MNMQFLSYYKINTEKKQQKNTRIQNEIFHYLQTLETNIADNSMY